MPEKMEVRRMDGEWYVFRADGLRYTFAGDEAIALVAARVPEEGRSS